MTAELERLVEECNIALRLMGWEIDTLINLETSPCFHNLITKLPIYV